MNKKILYVRTAPFDLNLNTYNVQEIGLGKAFCKLGYDFDLILFSSKGESEYIFTEINGHKLRVITKKRIRIFRTGICMEICDKELLQQYDFVISSEYSEYMTYALSKISNNVVMYSGPYYNLFFLPFMSPIYDFLFTKSINKNIEYKFVKSILAKEYLEKKGYDNVNNVGVGLDIERFSNNIDIVLETEDIVNYMQENECILYVGALSDRKNFPFLLETYTKIHRERPNIKFVIIGNGKENYVQRHFKKISEDVKKDIMLINKIDNAQLRFVYPLAKAFLLPSKLEIFGMVLLEAMYLGAPVVSSKNGGSLTLMENGQTGQIIEKFDSELWKNAILKYIDNSKYRSNTVQMAQELVKNEYNWEKIAQKMLEKLER